MLVSAHFGVPRGALDLWPPLSNLQHPLCLNEVAHQRVSGLRLRTCTLEFPQSDRSLPDPELLTGSGSAIR